MDILKATDRQFKGKRIIYTIKALTTDVDIYPLDSIIDKDLILETRYLKAGDTEIMFLPFEYPIGYYQNICDEVSDITEDSTYTFTKVGEVAHDPRNDIYDIGDEIVKTEKHQNTEIKKRKSLYKNQNQDSNQTRLQFE